MVRRKNTQLSLMDTPLEREIKTRLAKKYENEEKVIYERIAKAIDEASKSLEIELRALDDETKRRRQVLRHAKVAVKQIEPRNRMHIFLFKSTTGSWWKLGGNSVAIHRLMISTYLDREINVNVDRDNFAIFKHGVVCLQTLERFEADVAYSGAQLTLDDSIDFGPFAEFIRAYRLNVPLQEIEIKHYRKLDEEVQKSINNNVFAAAPDVELGNQITMVLRDGFQLEKQVDHNARGIIGHPLLDGLFQMRRAYYNVANNRPRSVERHEAMLEVDRYVGDVMTTLANYADLNLANKSKVAKVSLELARVREQAQQKINQYRRHNELSDKLGELRRDGGQEGADGFWAEGAGNDEDTTEAADAVAETEAQKDSGTGTTLSKETKNHATKVRSTADDGKSRKGRGQD